MEASPRGPDVLPPGSYDPVNGWPVKSERRNWEEEGDDVDVLKERYMEERDKYESLAWG